MFLSLIFIGEGWANMVKCFVAISFCLMLLVALKAQGKAPLQFYAALTDTVAIYNHLQRAENIYLYNPDSTMYIADGCLIASKRLNYRTGIGLSFSATGHAYWVKSYNVVSLFYLRNALVFLENGSPLKDLAECYRMLSRCLLDAGDLKLGWEYLSTATQLSLSLENAFLKAGVYNDLARYYTLQKKFDSARILSNEGLDLTRVSHDSLHMAILYSRLGGIFDLSGNYDSAMVYYDSSFYINNKYHENKRLRSFLLIDVARINLARGEYSEVIKNANDAMLMADTLGAYEIKLESLKLLLEAYDKNGSPGKKTFYLEQLNVFRDSIDRVQGENSVRLLEEYFALNNRLQEMEKTENSNKVKIESAKHQRFIILALTGFIVILIGGIITTYYFYNQKEKLHRQLTTQHEELQYQKNIIEEQSRSVHELNELKNKLFAVISHDLRTPISNLKMTIDLFRSEMLTREEAVDLMKKTLPLIDGTDLTLSNLLNWAMAQMNGIKVKPDNFSLFAIAEEMKKVFDFSAAGKNLTIQNHIPVTANAFAHADLARIIIRNLVSNAIKFSYENGKIEIAAIIQDKIVVVSVTDSGKGMRAEETAKLFNAGTHFTGSGTKGERGTGLGLLLCKDLVVISGGEIWVKSIPQKGSSFYFTLPVS